MARGTLSHDSRAPHAARLALAGCVALLIVLQLALRQDESGWNARAHPHGVVTLDGHLVEWEWFHVDEAIVLVDADVPPPATAHDQNVFRFVPAYVTALLREPLRSYYGGALVGEGVVWIAAAAALYALTRRATGRETAGVAAAILTAAGPGFIGYVGQVDAHPTAYAAVAVVPALLEMLGLDVPGATARMRAQRAVAGGLVLCIAGYTIEVAYPLLLFVVLFYGAEALLRSRRPRDLVPPLAELAVLTLAFVLPYVGFRLLMGALFEEVLRFNDPLAYLMRHPALVRSAGPLAWLGSLVQSLTSMWLFTFPAPVTALAVVGLAALARARSRWTMWALAYGAAFGAAVVLTKPTPRELFLLYPAVYLLAGAGVDAVVRALTAVARPRLSARPLRIAQGLVIAACLITALAATNADVWGDYTLPFAWYTLS